MLDESETRDEIASMRELARQVTLAPPLKTWVVSLVAALTPSGEATHPLVQSYVRYGPGPRGAQAIVLTAKVNALLDGRAHVAVEDAIDAALPALRHRLILNFQGEAEEGVNPDRIVAETLKAQRRP